MRGPAGQLPRSKLPDCVRKKTCELAENPIDGSRFEEYGGAVRYGPRPKEIRGLASADRTTRRVPAYKTGVGGGGRKIRAVGANSADFADMAREVFRTRELPKCARSTRGDLSVAAKGVASSVQDVNRYTAADSGSPRRRSVGHASHSRSVISRKGSGDFRSAASATTQGLPRRRPGGRPPPR